MKAEDKLIHLTDVAIKKFKEMVFDSETQDGFLKISLELEGTKMFYDIDVVADASSDDNLYNFEGLNVLVNEEDKELVRGLIIDYISDEDGESFVIDNPNIITELEDETGTGGCGCGCGYC